MIKIRLPLADSPTFRGCTLVTAPVCPAQSQCLCAVHIHSKSCLFIATTASLVPSAVEPVRSGLLLSHRPFPGAPQPQNKVVKHAQAALPHLLPLPGLFLAHFNCSTNPPFPTVIQLCTSPDPAVWTVVIKYLCDNIPSKYLEYKPNEFMKFAFIPAENEDGLHLGTI